MSFKTVDISELAKDKPIMAGVARMMAMAVEHHESKLKELKLEAPALVIEPRVQMKRKPVVRKAARLGQGEQIL